MVEVERLRDRYDYLLVAVPEIGLAGLLALRHIVRTLKMRYVGFAKIEPPLLLARYEDGQLKPLILLYDGEANGRSLLVVLCELPMQVNLLRPLADFIVELARRAEYVVMLGALPSAERDKKARPDDLTVVVASVNMADVIKERLPGVRTFHTGILWGPYALVLSVAQVERRRACLILTETFPMPIIPVDVASAIRVVKVVSSLIGAEISTKELEEQKTKFELAMRSLEQLATQARPREETFSLYT